MANLNSRWTQLSQRLSETSVPSGFLILLGPAENRIDQRQANVKHLRETYYENKMKSQHLKLLQNMAQV